MKRGSCQNSPPRGAGPRCYWMRVGSGQCRPVVSWSHKEFEHRSQDEGARQKETAWRYKPKGIRLRGKKWVLSLATDKTEL